MNKMERDGRAASDEEVTDEDMEEGQEDEYVQDEDWEVCPTCGGPVRFSLEYDTEAAAELLVGLGVEPELPRVVEREEELDPDVRSMYS